MYTYFTYIFLFIFNSTDEQLNHRLIMACKDNNIQEVKSLVDQGANVNTKNLSEWTPLLIAATKGGIENAQLLVERGAHVNAQNKHGNTALHFAADDCSYRLAHLLLKHGAHRTITNSSGHSALDTAKSARSNSLLELFKRYDLIDTREKLKNDPEYTSATKIQAYHNGCKFRRQKQNTLNSMLHLACIENNCPRIKFLVKQGANINKPSGGVFVNKLPLHAAIIHPEAVSLLLELGANVNGRDPEEKTALHYAANTDDENSLKIIEILIKAGADVNAIEKYNQTALHYTALHNIPKTTEFLMTNGADHKIKNYRGKTALNYAIHNSSVDTIRLLANKETEGTEIIAPVDYPNSIYLEAMLTLQKKINPYCTKTIRYDSSFTKAIVIGEDVYTTEGQQFTENMPAEQIADHLHAMFLKKEEQKAAAIKIQRFVRKNLKK